MNDIEILEDYIKTLKLTPEELLKNNEIVKLIEYKEIQAIENLINRVKELENYKRKHSLIKSHYIPKSKIQEKIEKYLHKDFIKLQVCYKHDEEALKIAEVLQELLEEE